MRLYFVIVQEILSEYVLFNDKIYFTCHYWMYNHVRIHVYGVQTKCCNITRMITTV